MTDSFFHEYRPNDFAYFPKDKGHNEIYNHVVTLNADRITVTDDDSIPTGELKSVSGTPFDLRVPRHLGDAMARLDGSGYDDNFCVTRSEGQSLAFVAR